MLPLILLQIYGVSIGAIVDADAALKVTVAITQRLRLSVLTRVPIADELCKYQFMPHNEHEAKFHAVRGGLNFQTSEWPLLQLQRYKAKFSSISRNQIKSCLFCFWIKKNWIDCKG